MKRIVTIQDISCVGKCSLTVALPIISAMGIETAIIPTAVLSSHTSFKSFTFKDLTEEILPIAKEWQKENLTFDAIYTGYLGSKKQINIIKTFIDQFKTSENRVIIDPVMADNGKLYQGFTMDFVEEMTKLCQKASIIIPNLTEACLLTKQPYRQEYDRAYIENLLSKLLETGCEMAVITGVTLNPGKIGVIAKKQNEQEIIFYENDLIASSYHGTGDIFSSTFVAALVSNFSIYEALKLAADFTRECINLTVNDNNHRWYGVNFEKALPYLIKQLKS